MMVLAVFASLTAPAQVSIPVPDYSFETPVTPYAGPDIDSWEKTPQPSWFTNTSGFTWTDLTGEFLNTPEGTSNHIDNCDGLQALFIQAYPEVGIFQDYDSTDWTNPAPTHAFNATFEPGKAYRLTVAVIGGGGDMPPGTTLELALYYYPDSSTNQVVVASTNIAFSLALFPNTTNFIDFSAQLPPVQPSDPWAGAHIGILLLSTASFALEGGYWDVDNVRLTATTAPVLSRGAVTNRQFAFTLTSDPGAPCEVLASPSVATPVAQWTSLGIVTNVAGSMLFTDTNAPASGGRFYLARVVQ